MSSTQPLLSDAASVNVDITPPSSSFNGATGSNNGNGHQRLMNGNQHDHDNDDDDDGNDVPNHSFLVPSQSSSSLGGIAPPKAREAKVSSRATPRASIATPKESSGSRLVSLDLLRGLIMIIMAWDHVKGILLITRSLIADLFMLVRMKLVVIDFLSDGQLPHNNGWEIWSGPFATYDNNVIIFLLVYHLFVIDQMMHRHVYDAVCDVWLLAMD
jgi:hypothetical protein